MNQILLLNNIIDFAGKPLPSEFRMFCFGANPAYKIGYGDFDINLNKQNADKVMSNNAGKEIVIDYEHGALMEDGQPHPKAGNAKLTLKDDGIWATDCRWTKRAAEFITNGEYDNFSPAIELDKNGMFNILCVSLTNMPSLKNTEALMLSKISTKKELTMSDNKNEDLLQQILKLTGTSDPSEALGILAAQKKNETQYKAEAEKAKLDALIDGGVRDRKLVGQEDKDEAMDLAKTIGVDAFKVYLSKLPSKLAGLPQMQEQKPKQPEAKTEEAKQVLQLSRHAKKIVEVMGKLDPKGKDELLKKLQDPQKAIENSPFFYGYGTKD